MMLNRPEKMNALTRVTYQEMEDAFRSAQEDDNVRVVIVTGAARRTGIGYHGAGHKNCPRSSPVQSLDKAVNLPGTGESLEMHAATTSQLLSLCFQAEDSKEGIQSFLEKREAQFKGR